MNEIFANTGDPNQTPRSAASDLGLHSLPTTLLGVSRLQRVKIHQVVSADCYKLKTPGKGLVCFYV